METKKMCGAIFDMDGVLFDSERLYSDTWHEIAADRGITLAADFTSKISGTGGEDLPKIIAGFYGIEDGQEIVDECLKRMNAKLSLGVPVKPGVPEALKFFRDRGYKICVASGSPVPMIEANLKRANLMEFFDELVSGQDFPKGKPNPDIFLHAAKVIGCEPSSCYVFEDSLNGIRAAYAASCHAVMIPDLTQPTDEIRPLCSGICKDMFDVMKEIEEGRL